MTRWPGPGYSVSMCKADVHTWRSVEGGLEKPVLCQEYVAALEEALIRVTADSSAPARVLESCVPGHPDDKSRPEQVLVDFRPQPTCEACRGTGVLRGWQGPCKLCGGGRVEMILKEAPRWERATLPDMAEDEFIMQPVQSLWFCVKCGASRDPNPAVTCPREGCGMKSYTSKPPENPVLPASLFVARGGPTVPYDPKKEDW